MAKKIIGGIGSVLGLKKKKKAPAAPEAATTKTAWEPVIKQLGGSPASTSAASALAARRRAGLGGGLGTLLSDKLGS